MGEGESEEWNRGEDGLPGEGGRGALLLLVLAAGLARLDVLRLSHVRKPVVVRYFVEKILQSKSGTWRRNSRRKKLFRRGCIPAQLTLQTGRPGNICPAN